MRGFGIVESHVFTPFFCVRFQNCDISTYFIIRKTYGQPKFKAKLTRFYKRFVSVFHNGLTRRVRPRITGCQGAGKPLFMRNGAKMKILLCFFKFLKSILPGGFGIIGLSAADRPSQIHSFLWGERPRICLRAKGSGAFSVMPKAESAQAGFALRRAEGNFCLGIGVSQAGFPPGKPRRKSQRETR